VAASLNRLGKPNVIEFQAFPLSHMAKPSLRLNIGGDELEIGDYNEPPSNKFLAADSCVAAFVDTSLHREFFLSIISFNCRANLIYRLPF
jgi:hypothetical protein